mmetsp:Transcript_7615/g.16228  ORF Transcript_7615/g.16228 Transcript_7615/m.16228 type:complete len:95 (-) Transcript_7615:244-528(-)
MLSGFLPGQEAGNVSIVTESGAGQYSSSPARIGKVVASWCADASLRSELSSRSREIGTPHATREIACLLDEYLWRTPASAPGSVAVSTLGPVIP